MSKMHDLKIWPEYYEAVDKGKKRFEVRKNDRGFRTGDVLRLREFDPVERCYSGRFMDWHVSYMICGGPWLEDDMVIMSLGVRL